MQSTTSLTLPPIDLTHKVAIASVNQFAALIFRSLIQINYRLFKQGDRQSLQCHRFSTLLIAGLLQAKR
ncbi:MAG: hypothetical protein HC769_34335 [Cyanobacteria bacterium CRU_2_1]|nr:hypothetical protein [Cyanobacteria bacterium RU_5_0]NJR63415.1 hypothetical protein [Cyanobacteria bacterium CRU_2_1]